MGIISSIIGTYSQRQVKKIVPLCKKIEAMDEQFSKMTDAELRAMTPLFKERLANGETLDDILPEAFATVREAAWRVLAKKPFNTQIIGGIVIHQGRIAEMKTGEGKTLTATMPAYLNALTGNGVHIVTVNDYLAKRDSEWMGKIYNFLGLSVGLVIHDIDGKANRKAAYEADITYGTNNEYGFDYLRDNRMIYKEQLVQRGHAFAIIDEVDSILIDEAKIPLIISGKGDKSTDLYEKADKFVKRLKGFTIKEIDAKSSYDEVEEDYIHDEKAKTVVLTKSGIAKAESYFGVDNLADSENTTINHHINQALKANAVMLRDVDYVIKDNQIINVDAFTGRLMFGRRYSDGLHQAIEAKENVKIENENKTLATITFQNYFRLYAKLSGMTGTALTEENEFREIYNLDVVEIPTYRPMIRKDHSDAVYKSIKGKYAAIVEKIAECNAKGQPILVGTVSVEKSELLSKILKEHKIRHNILNAKYHEKEAEIVAQAGKFGAVTISTNMAGRGTDIILGGNAEFMAKNRMQHDGYDDDMINEATSVYDTDDEEKLKARRVFKEYVAQFEEEIKPEAERVKAAGGLFILGTERHESRRIDNQLRGRSGRLGDPGESRFFLSLEDDLLRLFGSDRIIGVVERLGFDDTQAIDAKILSNTIENAQKKLEGNNFERRKNVLKYDDVMNQQRTVIYRQRREVIDGGNIRDKLIQMIRENIEAGVDSYCSGNDPEHWNFDALRAQFFPFLTNENDFHFENDYEKDDSDADAIKAMLIERAERIYEEKEKMFGENMREIERVLLLRNVDMMWMDHIDAMSDLTGSVGLHAYAQRDPIVEYRMSGAAMFDEMIMAIRDNTVRDILSVQQKKANEPLKRIQIATPSSESFGGDGSVKRTPAKNTGKVGRNDPCPCGSGKKYKKCCGLNET